MNDNNEINSIRDNILKSITDGRVTMRPKWHFVLRAILLISGIVLAVLALLYLISFIIFILHQTGSWFVPSFGLHGINEFLISFPWLIVLVAAIFLILLEILVRRYSFGYQKPLLYTTVGILILVTIGGFVVAATPLHRSLFDSARNEHLPFGGGFYKQFGTPHRDSVAIGSITQVSDTGYTIEDRRDMTFKIIISDGTNFPDGRDFQVGDSIAVFGDRTDNIIQAVGVKKVTGTEPPPPPHHDDYGMPPQ
jgi:hypothetical protein